MPRPDARGEPIWWLPDCLFRTKRALSGNSIETMPSVVEKSTSSGSKSSSHVATRASSVGEVEIFLNRHRSAS